MKMVKKLILSSIMALVLVLTIGCSNAEEKVKSNFEANLAALEMYKYDEKGISDALKLNINRFKLITARIRFQ